MIADRVARRVWAVDADLNVVWQYGVTADVSTCAALAVNHLVDPFYARYSPEDGGTVLIADNLRGCRVIEVQYGDYSAGAHGQRVHRGQHHVVYGAAGVRRTGPGPARQAAARSALENGNVLICDAGDDVREPGSSRSTGPPALSSGKYGVTGPPGAGDDYLHEANFASRLPDGDTLIADTATHRVLRVRGPDHRARVGLERLATSGLRDRRRAAPRAAAVTSDGRLVVADTIFQQIVTLGYEGSATATSLPLDCGHPGVDKAFVSLTWSGDTGEAGTKIGLEYRLGDGCGGRARSKAGCAGTTSKRDARRTIAYRVTLSTANRSLTPTLESMIIQSTKVKTGDGKPGGGGDKPDGSGNSGQSGVYAYPATAQGGTGTSGTGTGSGSYGTGTAPAPGASGPARPARAPAPARPPRRRLSTCRSSPRAAAPPWPSRATRSRARRA